MALTAFYDSFALDCFALGVARILKSLKGPRKVFDDKASQLEVTAPTRALRSCQSERRDVFDWVGVSTKCQGMKPLSQVKDGRR